MVEIELDEGASIRETILAARGRYPEAGVLVVRSSSGSLDVAAVAAALGLRSGEVEGPRGARSVAVLAPDAPGITDLRRLEAPEPLERILLAATALAPGAVMIARTPRVPKMLLPQLDRRGLEWACCREPDGSGLVWIRRPG